MSIKDARKAKNLTQEALSRRIGISQKTVSAYEKGMRKPSVAVAKRIGAVLDIPWASIFDDDQSEEEAHDGEE